jgi:hypothetical protein
VEALIGTAMMNRQKKTLIIGKKQQNPRNVEIKPQNC